MADFQTLLIQPWAINLMKIPTRDHKLSQQMAVVGYMLGNHMHFVAVTLPAPIYG